MIEKIQHINPSQLRDESELQSALILVLNVVENQSTQIETLVQENQALRDEINRLKGEHGSLPPKATNAASRAKNRAGLDKQAKKRGAKNGKKGSKKAKIVIDQEVDCPINKSILPLDARFVGYDTVVEQDIIFRKNNTLYKIPKYYSASQKKTYRGELPSSYGGQFGNRLKSWIQLFHHFGDMTEGRIEALLGNLGVYISSGTINNIILSHGTEMKQESAEILRSGIETSKVVQMDGTKSYEAGQGKSTQILCGDDYTVYHTMDSKSKVDIIWSLQGKSGVSVKLAYNDLALELFKEATVSAKDQKELGRFMELGKTYSMEDFMELVRTKAPQLVEKGTFPKVTEILALAHYLTQDDFPTPQFLLTDAGPEYRGIAPYQALCWIHEERHYKKMLPTLQINQTAVEKVRKEIWELYKKLLDFKDLSKEEQKEAIRNEFDEIFDQTTIYEALNDRLAKTKAKKQKLLLVLEYPQIPLHNNAAELAVRRKVRKRDISLHTMSKTGTQTREAFMSVIETAIKLGVNAFEYLYDRVTKTYQMDSLAQLIRMKYN